MSDLSVYLNPDMWATKPDAFNKIIENTINDDSSAEPSSIFLQNAFQTKTAIKFNIKNLLDIPREAIKCRAFSDSLDRQTKLFSVSGKEIHDKYISGTKDMTGNHLPMRVDVWDDMANLSPEDSKESVAFVANSLFGWSYVSPQRKTIGSAFDFGCIIADILYSSNKEKDSKYETMISSATPPTGFILKRIYDCTRTVFYTRKLQEKQLNYEDLLKNQASDNTIKNCKDYVIKTLSFTMDIKEVKPLLERLDVSVWKKIICHSYSAIYYDMQYSKSPDENTITRIETEKLQLINTLTANLGTDQAHPMGGMALLETVSKTNYGRTIDYVGDSVIFNLISEFLVVFKADIHTRNKQFDTIINYMKYSYYKEDATELTTELKKFFKKDDVLDWKKAFEEIEKKIKSLHTDQLKLMVKYVQLSEVKMKTDFSLEASLRCYYQKKISFIYHILNHLKSLSIIQNTPTYREYAELLRQLKPMIDPWFRNEISLLASRVKDPLILKEVRALQSECKVVAIPPKISEGTIDDARFWQIVVANIRGVSANKPEKNLYILAVRKGEKNHFYLYDVMPLIYEAKYGGALSTYSSPQWIDNTSIGDLPKKSIIVPTNNIIDIAKPDNWRAINIEWLDTVWEKANRNKSSIKWMLRNVFMQLFGTESSFQKFFTTKLGDNDDVVEYRHPTDSTQNVSSLKNHLIKLQDKDYIFIARENLQNELQIASSQF